MKRLKTNEFTPNNLLMDSRWRETTVTLLQLQKDEYLKPILSGAEIILDQMIEKIEELDSGFEWEIVRKPSEGYIFSWPNIPKKDETISKDSMPILFKWPRGLIHLFRILQDGLAGREKLIPDEIKNKISKVFSYANKSGLLIDKKLVLEFCGLLPEDNREDMLLNGLSIGNKWIDDIVYKNATKLKKDSSKNFIGNQ